MRRVLLSFLIVQVFAGIAISQTPIAHWPLDGNTQDIIGSKHGVPSASGVNWITDDPQRGECLQLDGVEGIVDLPSVIWTNETDTNTTITCWFNWAGGENWQRVYSLGVADPAWKLMYFCPRDGWDANGLHITFHAFEPDQWYDYVGEWGNMDFDTITPDQWYFSAIVLKEDSLKIWIDDQLVTAADSVFVTPQKIQSGDTSINVLGQSHWPDPTYNGMIDDFRIYGEALTNEQVLALYNEGGSGVGIEEINSEPSIRFYSVDRRIQYKTVNEINISKVSVYSITGSLLFSTKDISDLNSRQFRPGVYLISVENGRERLTSNVVVVQ